MSLKPVIAKPKGIIIFIIIFCILILGGLIILFFQEEEIRIFLFFFILFVLNSVYFLTTRFHFLKLKKDYFISGFSKYNYHDIETVILYNTRSTKFFFIPFWEKCVTLTLNNGKTIHLLEDYISNLWQIRYFIEKRVLENNKNFDFNFNLDFYERKITNKTSHISKITQLTSTLFYCVFIIFIASFALLFIDFASYCWITFVSFFALFLIFVIFYGSYYIESSEKGIIIKNLMLSHINKKINLKFIDNIRIQTITHSKGRNTLLIIKMIYHKEFKYSINTINEERTENIIAQIHKLNIPFNDYRHSD